MEETIRFELNGKKTEILLDPKLTLLLKNPMPSQQEIIAGMEENLCRFRVHLRIIRAIQTAGQEMKGGK